MKQNAQNKQDVIRNIPGERDKFCINPALAWDQSACLIGDWEDKRLL